MWPQAVDENPEFAEMWCYETLGRARRRSQIGIARIEAQSTMPGEHLPLLTHLRGGDATCRSRCAGNSALLPERRTAGGSILPPGITANRCSSADCVTNAQVAPRRTGLCPGWRDGRYGQGGLCAPDLSGGSVAQPTLQSPGNARGTEMIALWQPFRTIRATQQSRALLFMIIQESHAAAQPPHRSLQRHSAAEPVFCSRVGPIFNQPESTGMIEAVRNPAPLDLPRAQHR
jgi:hypothetical protein